MENVMVNVVRKLDKPKKESETITITQISEYENYLIDSDEGNDSGDILDIMSMLSKKIKGLGHDGSMSIELIRYVYEETSVESLKDIEERLFKG